MRGVSCHCDNRQREDVIGYPGAGGIQADGGDVHALQVHELVLHEGHQRGDDQGEPWRETPTADTHINIKLMNIKLETSAARWVLNDPLLCPGLPVSRTRGAERGQLVAEALPAAGGHDQEQVPALHAQVHGPQLQRPEPREVEGGLQTLLQVFGPGERWQERRRRVIQKN